MTISQNDQDTLQRPAGPMPWSGSRARSRDLGYAEAMTEVMMLAQDLERRGGDPAAALREVQSYANASRILGIDAKMTPRDLARWGNWPGARGSRS